MPITTSAKKANRVSSRKKILNLRVKKKLEGAIKLVKKVTENVKDDLSLAYQAIDKAVKRGVIKKNTAARKKSRITKAVNKKK